MLAGLKLGALGGGKRHQRPEGTLGLAGSIRPVQSVFLARIADELTRVLFYTIVFAGEILVLGIGQGAEDVDGGQLITANGAIAKLTLSLRGIEEPLSGGRLSEGYGEGSITDVDQQDFGSVLQLAPAIHSIVGGGKSRERTFVLFGIAGGKDAFRIRAEDRPASAVDCRSWQREPPPDRLPRGGECLLAARRLARRSGVMAAGGKCDRQCHQGESSSKTGNPPTHTYRSPPTSSSSTPPLIFATLNQRTGITSAVRWSGLQYPNPKLRHE